MAVVAGTCQFMDALDGGMWQFGDDLTFVAISGEVVIGHHTPQEGWTIDASVAAGIVAGTDYELGVSLKGTSVSIRGTWV